MRKSVVVVALLVLMWVSASAYYTSPYVDYGEVTTVPLKPPEKVQEGNVSLAPVGNAILFILQAFIAVGFAALIAGIFLQRREFAKHAFSVLLATSMVFAMFLLVVLVPGLTPGGGGGTSSREVVRQISHSYPGGFLGFVVMALIAGALISLIVWKVFVKTERVPEIKKRGEEVEKYILRAKEFVVRGDSVREAILRAFKELERMCRERGVSDQPHLTPLEFQEIAVEKLGLKRSAVEKLVLVFEEARYSTHEMGEEKRDEAIRALEEIRWELQGK